MDSSCNITTLYPIHILNLPHPKTQPSKNKSKAQPKHRRMKKYIVNLLFDLLYIVASLILTFLAYFMLNTIAHLILKPILASNEQVYNYLVAIFLMILFSMILVHFKKSKLSSQWKREDLSIIFFFIILALINAFSKSNITAILKPIFLLNKTIKNHALSYFISLVILSISYYTYLLIYRKSLAKHN